MTDHNYAVILAGGGGTRLWPLSRQTRPKQMLPLIDSRTLFQNTVDRLEKLFNCENIYVVTAEQQAKVLQEQCPNIPQRNFIVEPKPKGTASAIGLAAAILHKQDPEAVMASFTSDHFIEFEDRFLTVVKTAIAGAEEGYIMTLGIQPTYPATGFGYIEQSNYLETYGNSDIFRVKKFTEKPDKKTAIKFLEGEMHSWNSGNFVWKTSAILSEFERQLPEQYDALTQIGKAWGTDQFRERMDNLWPELEPQTIDYGIMENAENVAVVPARGLGWNDVGSWNALFDVLPLDEDGNVFHCEQHIKLNTKNTLVHTNGDPDRLVVTIGVQDLVVVDTGDVILICDRDRAQDVREIVKMLKEKRDTKYL